MGYIREALDSILEKENEEMSFDSFLDKAEVILVDNAFDFDINEWEKENQEEINEELNESSTKNTQQNKFIKYTLTPDKVKEIINKIIVSDFNIVNYWKTNQFKKKNNLTDEDLKDILRTLTEQDYKTNSISTDGTKGEAVVFIKQTNIKNLNNVELYIKLDYDSIENSPVIVISFDSKKKKLNSSYEVNNKGNDWYDNDWTPEDEDDIENYEEDDSITPEQEAFANELRAFLQSLIDEEGQGGDELEETSPYTNIKSNGIYSLNTGWVKHPVQQDIPDIDMEEFEKEFKVWEDRYFDLIDRVESNTKDDRLIDSSLIEDLIAKASRRGQTSLKKALVELAKIVLPDTAIDENLTWCVHHIDCDENNNKIENLSIIPLGNHTRLHASIRNNEIKDVHKVDDYAKDYNIVPVGPALAKIISDSKNCKDGDIIKESLKTSLNENTLKTDIDNLIEDIYNLRKEGMEEDGEYSIKNLIFKEFRNLGYLDNLKELRKKEISRDLSLESLKEKIMEEYNPVIGKEIVEKAMEFLKR